MKELQRVRGDIRSLGTGLIILKAKVNDNQNIAGIIESINRYHERIKDELNKLDFYIR